MTELRITKAELERTVARGIITAQQAAALWSALSEARATTPEVVPRFSITHVLYYLGGMIAIGAMSLFMNLGWERFGPWALCGIAVAYGIGCILASRALAERGWVLPAGILATLAIVLVPLATWALQAALGWWPPGGAGEHFRAYHTRVDWRWITLEFVTVAAAVIGLWRLRHPFMVMPLAVTLWYMSMDLSRMIVSPEHPGWNEWQYYRDFSLVFGLGMLAVAVWVDFRGRRSFAEGRDFAFWLYVFGTLAFWSGLSMQASTSELGKFIYLLINVGLVVLGAVLGRRVFAVFGAFGIAGYLGHLSYRVFEDSLLFPFALTLVGLVIVAAGIGWQRNERRLGIALRSRLPAGWREMLETRHEALRGE
jgi:hypothetical protein